ncbi:phage regulatory protein/antirepressor Ant [Curvivirga aplysinae]|uniref:phage regulatory protein/antirepressor Ant n=1 Tax=Curvivirga aplysinae TaxID=2529852 RepID=UPI0012BBAA27|nr:phage regulatory protein/antirepressor Ant [Curvivirga aplysinae]MTI10186.1 hypothetical protein [Curvivirga aplysinae]
MESSNNLPKSQPEPRVYEKNGVVKANSRDVAAYFKKEHRNVLQSIDKLDCSEEFRLLNFQQAPYVDEQNGQTYRMYEMTKDGFIFLVMGFTGKEAAKFKEAYIAQFNQIENKLRTGGYEIPDNLADALRLAADQTEKVIELEAKVAEDRDKVYFYESFANAEGLYGLQQGGRALNCKPNKFIQWLKQEILFYQGGNLVARIYYIQKGYFEVKSDIIDGKARPRVFITPKGLEWLAKRVPDHVKLDSAA